MDFANILSTATALAAILSVGSVLRQRNTIQVLKESNGAFKERIEQLEDETKQCLASHVVNDKKITALEAKLKTYDDLALVPKAFITKHDETQQRIVQILERIEDNQPNKDTVAAAVEQVKTDLETK